MQKDVQWYPGHMFKAKKEIIKELKNIDIVIEVIDARVPFSSHNIMLDEMTENKTKLLIFSKVDLVEKNVLTKAMNFYENNGYTVIGANIKNGTEQKKVLNKIMEVSSDIKERYDKKGIDKMIRVLVMGMPNVGKSTLINFLASKKKAVVGNKPGVTKRQQWINIQDDVEILDTPGILVPKIENVEAGYRLVVCQLIKEEVVHIDDVAVYLLEYLYNNQKKKLINRYELDPEIEFDIVGIYDAIGHKTGALLSKNEVDYERINKMLINDFRNLKFGKVMLENE